MGEGGMLYLLKSSRVQEYHQQNVAIVGATESDRFEISYSQRWIADGLEIKAGEGCVIVFADSPYEYFVPVRYGVIESVDRDDKRANLVVRLTALVRAGGIPKINTHFSGFSPSDPNRPGKRFLFEAENPGLESPQSISDTEIAWREIVDGLRANGYFEKSTFTRIAGLLNESGFPLDNDDSHRVGNIVTAEVEFRTPSDAIETVGVYVESEPYGAIEHDDLGQLPSNGVARIPLKVLHAGQIHATIRTLPEPLRSSRTSIGLLAIDDVAVESKAKSEEVQGERSTAFTSGKAPDLTALVRFLRREATLDNNARIELCELLLRDVSSGDPAVLSELAKVTYESRRFEECVRALRAIEFRRPAEDTLLLLAVLHAGIDADFDELLRFVDLEKEGDFEELLNALEGSDRSTIEKVSRILTTTVLGDERKIRLATRLFNKIDALDFALDLATAVAFANPTEGAGLIFRKWNPIQCPTQFRETLIDWDVGGNQLAPYYGIAIESAEAANRLEEVKRLTLRSSEVLAGAERSNAVRCGAEILLESGVAQFVDSGFELFVQSINDEISAGNFDVAVVLSQHLLGFSIVASDDFRKEMAEELFERSLASALQTPEYQSWISWSTKQSTDRLRPKLNGRTIHFVGGQELAWRAELMEELGLAECKWHVTVKRGGINNDWVDGLSADRDLVIVITEFIGHAVSTPLKIRCERKGVTRLDCRASKKNVLDALERHFSRPET